MDTIAVGIVIGAPAARLELPFNTVARNAEGVPYIVTAASLTLVPDPEGIRWFFPQNIRGPVSRSWIFHGEEGPDHLVVDGRPYRGDLLVIPAAGETIEKPPPDSRLSVINLVSLEDYLRGVVPRELGATRYELFEAAKAQAVVARTYAVKNRGRRLALGCDLFATTTDQVYDGCASESGMTDAAVAATLGEILLFAGAPAEAIYHSTCGGRTVSRQSAWGGEEVPYLRGVEDRLGDSFACQASKYFTWKEVWEGDTLARLRNGARAFRLDIAARDTFGRVRRLHQIRDSETQTSEGDAVRRGLRRPDGSMLRSTWFEIAGDTDRVIVTGRGWGHGVGMCQMGAIGRARAGWNYREILFFYYPGTAFGRLSPSRPSAREN